MSHNMLRSNQHTQGCRGSCMQLKRSLGRSTITTLGANKLADRMTANMCTHICFWASQVEAHML